VLDAIEGLERDADGCEAPDNTEQRPPQGPIQRTERDRCVGSGDEQIDRAVVELAQQRFRAFVRHRVIDGRCAVEQHHRRGEYRRADDVQRAAVLCRRGDEHRRRRDGRDEPDAVAQAVRDFLADRLRSLQRHHSARSVVTRARQACVDAIALCPLLCTTHASAGLHCR
jgi:hypothetical protein